MARATSKYASKGRQYDYSLLFRDVPENQRAGNKFLWTHELKGDK